jgi:rare lipoprotein A
MVPKNGKMDRALRLAARAGQGARKAAASGNGRLVGRILVLAATGLALTNCSSGKNLLGVSASPRVVEYGQPVPKGGGVYKVGNPYKVGGEWFYPKEDPNYRNVGIASWYGLDFHGRRTANGEIYDMDSLSAAHPTLPLPTYAKVKNLENGREVVVRINDRGPFARGREIDVSKRTAEALGFQRKGTTKVQVTYLGKAPLSGEDGWVVDSRYAEKSRKAVPPRQEEPRRVQIASAAPVPPMPSTGLGMSYIQAGSFRDAINADRLRHTLASVGQVEVMPIDVAGTTYFRVRVGPVSGEQAAQALSRVRSAGLPGAQLIAMQ